MGKKKKKQHQNKTDDDGHTKTEKEEDNKEKYPLKQILKKVDEYMESFNFELAEKFSNRALEMEPNNPQVLTLSSSVFLEIGRSDRAEDCLRRAISIEPDKGHRKYMILGELLEGDEAAECFKKGIELMIAEKEEHNRDSSDVETIEITDRDISSAFCSLAEIYLTDCCFSENAEAQCEEFCKKAIEQDENNPEAYQVMANFLLSEQKIEEAKDMLTKSLNLWKSYDDLSLKTVAPSYESRISLSKMLMEVEEYDNACLMLEALLQEDDEVVQVWYLLGWLHHLSGQDQTAVRYYLDKAKHVLLFRQMECDDEPLLQHIEELLSEIDKHKLAIGGDNENEEEDEFSSMDTTT